MAVVNRTNLKNYGSVLQVYALCEAVKILGYDSEVVWQSGNMSKNFDMRPNKILKTGIKLLINPGMILSTLKTMKSVKRASISPEKVKLFNDFVEKHFSQSFYAPNELQKVAASDKYYKFVCGSDQVWVTTTLYPDPMMYLRFAPRSKRVAYAPSLGRDYIPGYNKSTLRKYISEIDNVSVREKTGRDLIKQLTGRSVPVVADPTLLLSSERWDALKSSINKRLPSQYVLSYFLSEPSEEVKSAICDYVKIHNKMLIILGKMADIELADKYIFRPSAGPGEFLALMSSAGLVITDSYHGMLFAINYHRNFWSVERNYGQFDQSSRQLTVLSILGIDERYVKKSDKFKFNDIPVDYDRIQPKLDEFITHSMNYLKESLK